jgi:hypothetical protein
VEGESGEGHQVSESLELMRKEKESGALAFPFPRRCQSLAQAVWCQNWPTWCRCSFACFFFTIVLLHGFGHGLTLGIGLKNRSST